jgi:hypothetical protein
MTVAAISAFRASAIGMYKPPAGTTRENCEYRTSPVWIRDARAMASPPSTNTKASSWGTRRAQWWIPLMKMRSEIATTPKRPSLG